MRDTGVCECFCRHEFFPVVSPTLLCPSKLMLARESGCVQHLSQHLRSIHMHSGKGLPRNENPALEFANSELCPFQRIYTRLSPTNVKAKLPIPQYARLLDLTLFELPADLDFKTERRGHLFTLGFDQSEESACILSNSPGSIP